MDYILILAVSIWAVTIKIAISHQRSLPTSQAHEILSRSELELKSGKVDRFNVLRIRNDLRYLYKLQQIKPELPIVETVENLDLLVGDKDHLLQAVRELKDHLNIIDKELK